ncbi:MAG: HAMP domain-containing histidine kinase [Flavobacteriales bacterium]|jgi:signal transduction histidine kinase|nr:HAMP domain-containing histidine kinase [Flavobacteriales bacterium]
MKASPEQAERLHRFAHDLRNRLGAIRQVLAQFTEPAAREHADLLDFAEQQCFKALRATEELLDDFMVDRSPKLMAKQPVDLAACIGRAIDAQQHRFARKQQAVEQSVESGLLAQGDARLLEDLVCALLSNASKFSDAGHSISIRLRKANGMAEITVTDKGIGLDADDLLHVFTRYALLKGRSTAGEAQGRSTLARAKQWAEAHGGELTASSNGADQGSAFTLRLPLA